MSIEALCAILVIYDALITACAIRMLYDIKKLKSQFRALDRRVTNYEITTTKDLIDIHEWIKASGSTIKSMGGVFDMLIAKCASLDNRLKEKGE